MISHTLKTVLGEMHFCAAGRSPQANALHSRVGRLLTENEEQSICKSPFLIMTAQRTAHHEDAVVSSPLFGDDAWMDKSR